MTYDDNVRVSFNYGELPTPSCGHQWKLVTTNQRIDTFGKLKFVEIIVFCKFCLKTKIIKEIVSEIEEA
jgi:hypothetical protein